ncbi:MAG: UDPglucose 6-dehydrogenase [Polyangiales bacterium]|jgi:UDPglucose 6-dehydrogenase
MIGTGYVGLVSGACFAETGQNVICVDNDLAKVEALQRGEIPIFEPGLDDLVSRNQQAGRLKFTADAESAVRDAPLIFVAVGTPPGADGGADLSAVESVAALVAKNVTQETVLVLKSTVPVGTNERVRAVVAGAAHTVHVVSNPEFLREGDAINDFMKPDRIIIGCEPNDELARTELERVYHPVTLSGSRIVWMDPASAELTKYVSNTMLAMRISFMNEVASLCDVVGADIHQVRRGVGSDSRIGKKFLYAGPGYGGSCFPKDVQALIHTAQEQGVELQLAGATHRVNQQQKDVVLSKLKSVLGENLSGTEVALWGVAFKPNTNDTRESPALHLVRGLVEAGARVRCHDPEAMRSTLDEFGESACWVDDAYAAAKNANALCLMTEWRQYQNPDFKRLLGCMTTPLLVDARNIWSSYGLAAQGFEYLGIGTTRTSSS